MCYCMALDAPSSPLCSLLLSCVLLAHLDLGHFLPIHRVLSALSLLRKFDLFLLAVVAMGHLPLPSWAPRWTHAHVISGTTIVRWLGRPVGMGIPFFLVNVWQEETIHSTIAFHLWNGGFG